MKKLCSLVGCFFIGLNLFATPLIDAAKNQDYKKFETLVKQGSSLDEVSESGMNVQLSLAYFNDKDFSKACSLLSKYGFNFDVPLDNNISLLYVLAYSCSYEKISVLLKYDVDINRKNSVTNLKPIDATQFSTFKFYSEQKINPSNYNRAKKTRDLLMKHGSEEFSYCAPTHRNIGNAFFCLVNAISYFYPFITPQMINSKELFDFSETNGQESVTLRQDKMKELLNELNLDVEIENYYDTKAIFDEIIEAENSTDPYMLIGSTGNNPVAPFQWININGVDHSKNKDGKSDMDIANPDSLFQFVDFQVSDLSHLISIRIK